jgi:hypothetical protein
MLLLVHKIIPTMLCWLFLVWSADKSIAYSTGERSPLCDTDVSSGSDNGKGYCDIVHFQDKYIAVGTDGRIDGISKEGDCVRLDSSCPHTLRCAWSNDELVVAAGEYGSIFYSFDGNLFYSATSGTRKNIHGMTSKNGLIIAGADSGIILISKNGTDWKCISTSSKGNILSLTSNTSLFLGISDSGEILKSIDGLHWEIQDYNKDYAGYTRHIKFRKISANQNSMIIVGLYDDGSPAVLFSSMGKVWAERAPVYQDAQGSYSTLTQKPNAIAYDPDRDQFIVACDHGELFSLPSCSKCDKYLKISESDLQALVYFDNRLVIVGDGFSVFIQQL